MRTRSRNDTHQNAPLVEKRVGSNGTVLVQNHYADSTGYNWVGQRKTCEDTVTSGWPKILRQQIVLNPIKVVTETRKPGFGVISYPGTPFQDPTSITGDFSPYFEREAYWVGQDLEDPIDRLYDIALVKTLAKVNQAGMNSMETYKDLGSTIGMLRRPLQGCVEMLSKMTKHYNRHLKKTAVSATKAASNTWLEYRYGWKPLAMDVETIIDAAHNVRAKYDKRHLVARSTVPYQTSDAFDVEVSDAWTCPGTSGMHGTLIVEINGKVSAGVVYDLKSQTTIDHLNRTLGARPQDVPAGLWECIPYSFVADWFLNVGDWLRAVTPDPSVTLIGNWVTKVVDIERKVVNLNVYKDSWYFPRVTAQVGGGSMTKTIYHRVVNQSVPSHPVPTLKPLTLVRSLDGIGLTLQKVIVGLTRFRH